jgi:hypothetical protein
LLGRLDTQSFVTRDEQEVAGYAFVMEQVFAHAGEIPVSENMILQLHRDLLQFSSKDERHRGSYKSLSNNVAAFDADGRELGVVFETSPPSTPGNIWRRCWIGTGKRRVIRGCTRCCEAECSW